MENMSLMKDLREDMQKRGKYNKKQRQMMEILAKSKEGQQTLEQAVDKLEQDPRPIQSPKKGNAKQSNGQSSPQLLPVPMKRSPQISNINNSKSDSNEPEKEINQNPEDQKGLTTCQ